MSKISLDEVKQTLKQGNLTLISTKYENLDALIEVKCTEGHTFTDTFRNLRKTPICPICAETANLISKNKIKTKKGIRILAIDQATINCGWALFENKELIGHGVYCVNENYNVEQRISMVNQELIRMIKDYDPDAVYLEDIQLQDFSNQSPYSKVGILTFKTLAELLGVLKNTLYNLRQTFYIIPSATWRSYVGVKGRSRSDKKKSGQLIVQQKYGFLVKNDESDAILLGEYGVFNYRPKVEMIKW